MIRRVLAVAAVVALSGSGLFLLAEPAGAQACDVTGNPGLLPIVLIHGFNTKPETIARDWKQASNAITKAGGNPVLFDYASKSLEWVTRSGVAERLKATVECLAKASIDAGGSGKVGIVAHSMGGLAVRAALKAGLDPHLLAGLITISTPHLGSAFDSALVRQVPHAIDLLHANSDAGRGMAPGSPDMAGLPVLPADVPAELIGGDVRVCTTVFGWAGPGACVATPDPLVPIQSSLASGWPASPNRTTTTITCNTTLAFFAIDLITFKGEHVPCSHGPIRHHRRPWRSSTGSYAPPCPSS